MSFFRNVATTLSASVVSIPIAIVSSIVLARALSVAERGEYSLATTFAALAALLIQFSWGSGSIYRLKRMNAPADAVVSAALGGTLSLAAIGVGLSLVARDAMLGSVLDGLTPELFALALPLIAITVVATTFSNIARGIDRFGIANFHTVFANVVSLTALGWVLVARDGSAGDALAAYVIAQGVAGLVLVGAILRHTGLRVVPPIGEMRAALSFGVRSYAQNLAGRLHERLDLFMIAYFLADTQQVAFYTIAVGLISRVKVVPDSIGRALFPRLAGGTDDEAVEFTAYASRHSFVWVCLLAVGLAVVGPFLIPLLYGEAYRASTTAFLVLLPGTVMLTIYKVFARYFMALGRQRVNIVSQWSSTALNVALNVVLIPRYGIVGAAAASLISYTVSAIMVAVVFFRDARIPIHRAFVTDRSDLSLYEKKATALLGRVRR